MAIVPDNALKVILPAPYHEAQLWYGRSSGYDAVAEYREVYNEEHYHEPWYEDTKGWYHDPEWNYRFMSIQCAHDGNHPVWAAAHALARWGYITAATGPLASLFMY